MMEKIADAISKEPMTGAEMIGLATWHGEFIGQITMDDLILWLVRNRKDDVVVSLIRNTDVVGVQRPVVPEPKL